jgi:hypothetical protein
LDRRREDMLAAFEETAPLDAWSLQESVVEESTTARDAGDVTLAATGNVQDALENLEERFLSNTATTLD